MADAAEEDLARGEGVASEVGEVGGETPARNSEAVPNANQSDSNTGQEDDGLVDNTDEVEGDGEASVMRSSVKAEEHITDEDEALERDALDDVDAQHEDTLAGEHEAEVRQDEHVSMDEPDLTNMDAPALRELILQMRADHNQQLQAEERARAEVEDMCLRIEKHFKAEKAARSKAEELMQNAIENELSAKGQLDMEQQRLGQVENDIEMERDKVRQERDALEAMRVDFEHELQHAQTEVAKAQDALKTAEDRVRASEQVERQKIISDYELRLMSLANELMRANHETQLRTTYMSREMQRYQNAAQASANAVVAAKKEMHARRQDVDAMRSKLDIVMDRLAYGTEAASVLQANMNSGQEHAGQLFADPQALNASGLATLMPGNPNFQATLGQQMLLGAPKSLTRNNTTVAAPATRKTEPRVAKPKTIAAVNAAPGNINNTMQSARLNTTTTKSQNLTQRRASGATAGQGKFDGSRFDGAKVRNENQMAATMANW